MNWFSIYWIVSIQSARIVFDFHSWRFSQLNRWHSPLLIIMLLIISECCIIIARHQHLLIFGKTPFHSKINIEFAQFIFPNSSILSFILNCMINNIIHAINCAIYSEQTLHCHIRLPFTKLHKIWGKTSRFESNALCVRCTWWGNKCSSTSKEETFFLGDNWHVYRIEEVVGDHQVNRVSCRKLYSMILIHELVQTKLTFF